MGTVLEKTINPVIVLCRGQRDNVCEGRCDQSAEVLSRTVKLHFISFLLNWYRLAVK